MVVDWSSGSTPMNYTAHGEDDKISHNVIIRWSHQLWGCIGGGELRHYEVTWHIQHRPRPLPLSLSLSSGSSGDLFDLLGISVSDGDLPPGPPVLFCNQPHTKGVPATLREEETVETSKSISIWRIINKIGIIINISLIHVNTRGSLDDIYHRRDGLWTPINLHKVCKKSHYSSLSAPPSLTILRAAHVRCGPPATLSKKISFVPWGLKRGKNTVLVLSVKLAGQREISQ